MQILDKFRSESLRIGIFSKYDYAILNKKQFGKVVILKNALKSGFNINSHIISYENAEDAKKALLKGNVDMIFGLRPDFTTRDKIYYAEPIFTRDYYLASRKDKFENLKKLNVSAIFDQSVVAYKDAEVSKVFRQYLNSNIRVIETSKNKEMIEVIDINQGINYGVFPGDQLPEIFPLTDSMVVARFIKDRSGRLAVSKPELIPLINLIEEHFKSIPTVSLRKLENEQEKLINQYLFRHLAGLTEKEEKFINDIKTIKVFVGEDRYPLVFAEDNELRGIYIDELKIFAELLGAELQYDSTKSLNELGLQIQPNLKDNEIILNYFQYVTHDKDNVDVIKNYIYDQLIVYGRTQNDNNWQNSDKIGVVNKAPAHKYMEQIGFENLITFNYGNEMFEALDKGKVDYVIALEISYLKQIILGDYWLSKISSLPVILPLEIFVYNKNSPIGSLFTRSMKGFIDYSEINAKWRDSSDRTIANFMYNYYINLSKETKKQFILIFLISLLAILAFSMYMLLRVRTAKNEALATAAKAAKEASIAKSRFLSNMSHEIRTPLNAIIGLSQIATESNDPAKALEVISQIEVSGHHLLILINDVLDMSKIEANKFTISNEAFNIIKCINDIKNMITIRASQKQLEFKTTVEENIPEYIMGDKLRIHQILINILSNAVKFTPENGKVSFDVRILEETTENIALSFKVTDTGIGITKENITKIFTPFEQADSSITKSFGGTGLGLSISKKLAQLMNGSLSVDSEKNKGSTFTFSAKFKKAIEFNDTVNKKKAVSDLPEQEKKQINILIVDDISINRLVAKKMLEKEMVQTNEAASGKEALELYLKSEEGHYSIILMDVHMPEMNGYDATRAIRQSGRHDAESITIIALTASAFKEDVEMAIDMGMDDHIAKPIDMKTLIAKVNSYR